MAYTFGELNARDFNLACSTRLRFPAMRTTKLEDGEHVEYAVLWIHRNASQEYRHLHNLTIQGLLFHATC